MTSLINRNIANSYKELIKIDKTGTGIDGELSTVVSGDGASTPLQLATNKLAVHGKMWPATGGDTPGAILQVSADPNQLEWGSASAVAALQSTTSFFPGTIAPMVGTIRWYPGKAVTLKSLFMSISTTPTVNIVIDVKKSGVSIFGADPKLTILAGSNISEVKAIEVELAATDYITIDIISGNGSDMNVRLEYI